jgi:high-affinity iron transporter
METALVIMVREGFEAALIVAIVLAYLRRTGRSGLAGPVWAGVAAAAGVAFAVGLVVRLTVGQLEGVARLRAFAGISAAAVVVLTWMVFWMRRQSRLIRSDLERRVDAALRRRDTGRALAGVAFVAVLREGIEAALFLLAAATGDDGLRVLLGGLAGLAVAAALAWLVYAGGRALPMRAFFTVTGMVLIVFAAGLVARTVLFLQSAGDMGSFNLNGVYDVRSVHWLTQQSEVGRFLAAMFGWDPRPSIEQVVGWAAYLLPVSWLFLSGSPAPAARPAAAPAALDAAAEPAP